jgi:hypothetical protein
MDRLDTSFTAAWYSSCINALSVPPLVQWDRGLRKRIKVGWATIKLGDGLNLISNGETVCRSESRICRIIAPCVFGIERLVVDIWNERRLQRLILPCSKRGEQLTTSSAPGQPLQNNLRIQFNHVDEMLMQSVGMCSSEWHQQWNACCVQYQYTSGPCSLLSCFSIKLEINGWLLLGQRNDSCKDYISIVLQHICYVSTRLRKNSSPNIVVTFGKCL